MKKIFRGQVILSAVYTVTAIVVFLYTLVFMTEYNDLFGLKMPQNKQIRPVLRGDPAGIQPADPGVGLVGIIGILMIVLLEIRTAVPGPLCGCCDDGVYGLLLLWRRERHSQHSLPSGRITRDWIFSICTLTESPGMNSNLLRFRWVSGYIVCRLLSA